MVENCETRFRVLLCRKRHVENLFVGIFGMVRDADWLTCVLLFVVPAACTLWYQVGRKLSLAEMREKRCKSHQSRDRNAEKVFVGIARMERDADWLAAVFWFVVGARRGRNGHAHMAHYALKV